jgi:deoxyribodipyrimidine photo-lyase
MPLQICWLRRDLRLFDQAALSHSLQSGIPTRVIFIFDPIILSELPRKDRRVQFIHQQLNKIAGDLRSMGSDLWVFHAKPDEVFKMLLEKHSISAVYTNHDYEPYARKRDQEIAEMLENSLCKFHSFKDQVIFEQSEVLKPDGTPYTVFTPYSKKWKEHFNPSLTNPYECQAFFKNFAPGIGEYPLPKLPDFGFESCDIEFPETKISDQLITGYQETRDIPSLNGTSRLSIHLRFGTISIRQLVKQALPFPDKFLNELIWREFYQCILWHFPQVVHQSFKPAYDRIQWRNDPKEFEAWCQGKTGYPIVDAGMRELLNTGWMHNRVRMIVASFLTKHLLIDWRWGEAFFAEHLNDFELASNNGGWQWAAGCGVDAAPYFRIFNPALQTQKFDPQGKYIRQWVPEFDSLNYVQPIVDHTLARNRCLKAFQQALK